MKTAQDNPSYSNRSKWGSHRGQHERPVFPLSYLPIILLAQIFNKLKPKGFFRLRQTCKTMDDVVRNAPNIWTSWNGDHFCWRKNRFGALELRDKRASNSYAYYGYNLDSFYGVRLDFLPICFNEDADYEQLYNILKWYRITCKHLSYGENERNCPKNYFDLMVKILKPESVTLDVTGRCRNLLDTRLSRPLETLKLSVESCNALEVAQKFIRNTRSLIVNPRGYWTFEGFFLFLRGILQIHHLEPLPNLVLFSCKALSSFHSLTLSAGEVLGMLHEFRPSPHRQVQNLQDPCYELSYVDLYVGTNWVNYKLYLKNYRISLGFLRDSSDPDGRYVLEDSE